MCHVKVLWASCNSVVSVMVQWERYQRPYSRTTLLVPQKSVTGVLEADSPQHLITNPKQAPLVQDVLVQ